jgi:sulfhydrogenase subunit delta
MKLNVGWFSFTCCEDSTIVFIELMNERFFEWRELINFKYFRTLKSNNSIDDLDIAFVEGAISSKKEEETLRKIRENSKKLVAIGSCACTGSPANQRNFFDEKTKNEIQFILNRFNQKEFVLPLSDLVKVDDYISGCPMDENVFLVKLHQYFKEFELINA